MSKVKTKTPVVDSLIGLAELPLSTLVLTDKNVRKLAAKYINCLADSIYANGLKQNLVVCPVHGDTENNGSAPAYAVVAGRRRYLALCSLRDLGRIADDYLVKVLIEDPEQSTVTSLTENFHREAMHPADEFRAFSQLFNEGLSVGEIALKFGISEHLVKQRLALGSAAPELLEEYQNEAMNLEQLMVLCQVDDLERQKELWFATPQGWQRNANELRKIISNEAINLSSKLVKFVGLDVYEAQGGTVQRDLFSEEERYSTISDPQLLKSLVFDKFKSLEQDVFKAGWAWVQHSFDYDDAAIKGFVRCFPKEREITESEAAALNLWEERLYELEEMLSDYEEPQDGDTVAVNLAAEQAEYDNLVDTMDKFQESLLEWGDIQNKAGVYLYLTSSGDVASQVGLVRKEDMDTEKKIDGMVEGNGEVKKTDCISSNLQSYLACVRTSALQAELVKSPDTASILLVHSLALKIFYCRWTHGSFFDIALTPNTDEIKTSITGFENTPAGEYLGKIHAKWQSLLPTDQSLLLDYLFSLGGDDLQELLAYSVGQTLNTHQTHAVSFDGFCKLSELLNLSIFNYWKPTKDNFFGRLKKSQIFSVLADAGVSCTDLDEGMKKDLIAAQAEALIKSAPDWLPEQLRA
jgi:ParB family transcriptional regulator, chromosome partitioning protein